MKRIDISLWAPPNRSHDLAQASAGTDLRLRSYCAKDRQEVLRLYRDGLLAGIPDPVDLATDLDHIEDVYLKRPQDHFWVVEVKGHVIASIALTEHDRQVAHVSRLRVEPVWKMWHDSEVARVLIEKATRHAREHDCLKLVLHRPVNDERAIAFLHQMGFEYAGARELGGRHLLEFYVNLYMRQDRPVSGNEDSA